MYAYREAGMIAHTVMSTLIPPRDKSGLDTFHLRIRHFTKEQKAVIHEFLEYMVAEHNKNTLQKAINQYWGKY
ncbi:MAG: DUF6714 family protein [bacterium]|nr:DUF6714 family protein [bacterium]